MRTRPFRSRTFRSAGFAIGVAAIMVFATESRNAAQQGAVIRQSSPVADAALIETCIGSANALRDMSGYNGRARFVGSPAGRPIRPAVPAAAGASAAAAARAYLSACGSLFGLGDTSDLTVRAERRIDDKRSVVRFQQTHDGIPVLGGELVAQIDTGGNIISVSGELLPEAPAATAATVGAFEAQATALESVAKEYGREASSLFSSEPKLWIYAPSLLAPTAGPSRLVWRFEVTAGELEPIRQLVLIDATLGGVALTFNQIHTARNRLTYTANNTQTLPGTLVCNEANNTCAGGSLDAQGAHLGARDAYDYYAANHARDSINNAGMTLTSTVHFGVNYQNAFWNSVQMVYGDGFGFARADDVVGHELTHGVTEHESGLFYYYQSGAINESLSDVFGEFIDLTNGRGTDTAAVRWQMGEDVSGLGAIRHMANPPAFGDPDRMLSPLYHFATSDGGGVHINSGVNNKAAYLMTDGGAFNGQTVSALGIAKVSKIYYEANANLLSSGSDYIDLYNLLYQACQNLIGTAGITAADCTEVREATLAVEMNREPAAGFHPDAPVCTIAGQVPTNAFFDGLEAGSANWTFSAATGTSRFGRNTSPYGPWAHSGASYLYGRDDPAAITDAFATMNNPVVVPANAYMIFHHVYELEATFDGGVVEYSANGGAWTSALSLFDFHAYPAAPLVASGNPLAGQRAFNGSSRGYLSSRLNLASLAGQSVRFRFRMGLDASVFWGGWFIDDVQIYTCNNPVTESAAIQSLWPVTGAQTGGNATLWALVRNTGTVALPADARVWYLVNGPSFNQWVGSTSVAGLAPGATAWYSFNWAIPAGATPGNYEYRAQVWKNSGALSTLFGPQAFTVGAGTTVAAAIQSLWPVTGAQQGSNATLWALVRNTGTVALPADARVWYLVNGPSFNAWVGFTSVAGLAPGATAWYSFNWAVPANQTPGNYEYRAQVWTNTNSISTLFGPQAFSIAGTAVQANVLQLWEVVGIQKGTSAPLWALVRNTGTVALPADARVWFQVFGPSYASWVGNASVAGLAPGATAWYSFNWTAPAGLADGAYRYHAQVWTNTQAISNYQGPMNFLISGLQSHVLHLWPVAGAARGATVPLWAYVFNQSNTALPAGARVWFYVVGPGYSAWVGSTLVQGLPGRAGGWYSFNWTIPNNQPLGAYNYFAQVWTGTNLSTLAGPQAFSILTFAIDGEAISFATPPDPFVKPEGFEPPPTR
jgi:Zn-dependent metalloprotease